MTADVIAAFGQHILLPICAAVCLIYFLYCIGKD